MCGNGRPWTFKQGSGTSDAKQHPAQQQHSMAESLALSNTSRATYTKGGAVPQSAINNNHSSNHDQLHSTKAQQPSPAGFWVPATSDSGNEDHSATVSRAQRGHKGQQGHLDNRDKGGQGPSVKEVKRSPTVGASGSGGHTSEHNRTGSGDYEDALVTRYRNRLSQMQHKLATINCEQLQKGTAPSASLPPLQCSSSKSSPLHK